VDGGREGRGHCARLARVTDRRLPKLLGPVLRRGPGQVQVGVDAGRAVVLDGLDEDTVAALRRLDGTHPAPEPLRSGTGAAALAVLHAEGLVVDPVPGPELAPAARALLEQDAQALVRVGGSSGRGYAALSARGTARVLVLGRGALPGTVATTLRRAGVGDVRLGEWAGDEWEQVRAAQEAADDPSLVVLAGAHAIDPRAGTGFRRHGIPVLPVVLGSTEAMVGPLVAGAADVTGGAPAPCLHCLDLTRTDLDPAWPAVLEQLTRPVVGVAREVGGETTLVAMAAAMTAMVALGSLDGQPLPPGRSLEVGLPWPGVRQRDWPVHPRCACASGAHAGVARTTAEGPPPMPSAQTPADTSGRPADGEAGRQVRMAG